MEKLEISTISKELFNKVNGSDAIYNMLVKDKYPAWNLINYNEEERKQFLLKRDKYLLRKYSTK